MNDWEEIFAHGPLSLDEFVEAANALLPRFLPETTRGDARQRAEVNARLVRHMATARLMSEPHREGREARYDAAHMLQLLVARRLLAEGYSSEAIRKLLRDADEMHLRRLLEGRARLGLSDGDSSGNEATASGEDASRGANASNAAMPIIASCDEYSEEVRLDSALAPRALLEVENATAKRSREKGQNARDFLQRIQSRSRSGQNAMPARASPSGRTPSSPLLSPSNQSGPRIPQWSRYEVRRGLELHFSDEYSAPATPHERDALMQQIEALLKHAAPQPGRKKR